MPALVVCDNLKAGVTAACRYEPGINRSYQDLATHYGTTILPTRVRKPRDKAKVEVAVLIVERWILARLRHRRFFSLAELNVAIAELLAALNARPMRRIGAAGGSCSSRSTRRRSLLSQPNPTNTPSGRRRASLPTITSKCTATSTRCRPP